jgi:phosphoribosylanthranilate isomerase
MLAPTTVTRHPVAIKICGCVDVDNAVAVAAMGVDYLGVNCWPLSKRFAAPMRAMELCQSVRSLHRVNTLALVGLFVNAAQQDVLSAVETCTFDVVQLHGEESVSYIESLRRHLGDNVKIWRAIPVTPGFTWSALNQLAGLVDGLVLDTPSIGKGGSGRTFDWTLLHGRPDMSPLMVLAGGLSEGNVAAAIDAALPNVVDVASGVEDPAHPGFKNLVRVAAFLSGVRTV